MPSLWRIDGDALCLSQHPGQKRAWASTKRFTFVLAGTQSGKTSWAPWWLVREIQNTADPAGIHNDYIAATSSYDLFKLKFLPEIRNVFEHILDMGRYWSGDRILELRDPETDRFWAKRADDRMWGRIVLRSAGSGSGLESSTARGALLDECGQEEFSLQTYEAILRRLSLYRGRVLGTTTLYDLGWLKTEIWDKFQAGDPDIEVINFDSTENPMFAPDEFERARRSMPPWRFDMFYRGLFTRPAGQIYDSFKTEYHPAGHKVKPFPIPVDWPRYMGLDFGGVNTCAGKYAAEIVGGELTGRYVLYQTYKSGGKSAREHAAALMDGEARPPICAGGSGSEDQWRREFSQGGLHVMGPAVTEVEVGIDRVYGAHRQDRLFVFDTESGYLDQKQSYSRELDEQGNPTEKIKDKERYHYMDQERYIASHLFPVKPFFAFSLKRHTLPADDLPFHANYFAGLRYGSDTPSAFVLCATDARGGVYVLTEMFEAGLLPTEQAARIVTVLKKRGIENTIYVPMICNPEMFVRPVSGRLAGRAIAEDFRRAGLSCIETVGDDTNRLTRIQEFLVADPGLKIVREACPTLCACMPIVGYDVKNPDEPDMRGPVIPVQALAQALTTRPQPSLAPKEPDVLIRIMDADGNIREDVPAHQVPRELQPLQPRVTEYD